MNPQYGDYNLWFKQHSATKPVLKRQRKHQFSYRPKISVVIPLYNTPLKYLREILESLLDQSYENLEICLADGSSEENVGKYITKKYGKEPRVIYKKLKRNKGISENTNAAIDMASGEFIMLSDHDDVVTKDALFENSCDKYSLRVDKNDIADTIASEDSFKNQLTHFEDSIDKWSKEVRPQLLALCENIKPKQLITVWSQSLLDIMKEDRSLVDQYDTYQQLMTYWNDTMQDDCYLISRDGWKVTLATGEKKNPTYEDMTCELLPVSIVLDEYFDDELVEIERLSTESAQLYSEMQEMMEQAKEESGEEDEDELKKIVDQLKKSASYKAKDKKRKDLDKDVKDKKNNLTTALRKKYQELTEDEIKHLVVDKKWISTISDMILDEMKQVTHQLSNEVITLAERYEFTLSYLSSECNRYEEEVNGYLKEMGFEI